MACIPLFMRVTELLKGLKVFKNKKTRSVDNSHFQPLNAFYALLVSQAYSVINVNVARIGLRQKFRTWIYESLFLTAQITSTMRNSVVALLCIV